jgi:predicted nucleic acid-binding protein
MTIVAVLDADVLFPMYLRDTLLRLAAAGCFRLHWSDRILEEVTRNLVSHHRMDREKATRLEGIMRATFPEAEVLGWESLESEMTNHPKDRHVAAAASVVQASAIVTRNTKDFASLPDGILAMTPDSFLIRLFETHPEEVVEGLQLQARGYRNPPAKVAEVLGWLTEIAPGFAERVAGHLATSGGAPDTRAAK